MKTKEEAVRMDEVLNTNEVITDYEFNLGIFKQNTLDFENAVVE